MRVLSGTDERLLGSPELLPLILPAIRADFAALRAYRAEHAPESRVTCPVTALIGTSDPMATPDDAAAWERFAAGGFELRVFEGGHFYLSEHREAVAQIVKSQLTAVASAA
jgi:surfactin synthase thioesterase subunit